MIDITGLISVPQYQQCNISIVFSNEAGSSEPFILIFGKYVSTLHIYLKSISLTDTYPPSPNITNVTTTGTITVHFNITTTTITQISSTTTPVATPLNISIG